MDKKFAVIMAILVSVVVVVPMMAQLRPTPPAITLEEAFPPLPESVLAVPLTFEALSDTVWECDGNVLDFRPEEELGVYLNGRFPVPGRKGIPGKWIIDGDTVHISVVGNEFPAKIIDNNLVIDGAPSKRLK